MGSSGRAHQRRSKACRISRFLGIVIRRYYDEHNPPHLHAEYAGRKVLLDFQGNILHGDLGPERLFGLRVNGSIFMSQNSSKTGNSLDSARILKKLRRLIEVSVWELSDVVSVEHRSGYVFHIIFDDGLEGDVEFLRVSQQRPIFAALKDPSFFRQASVVGGTIAWPNGADLAPETLYEKIEKSRAAANHRGR